MKKYLSVIYLILISQTYCQDFQPEDFFPFHLGDVWEYYTENGIDRLKITKDSLSIGGHYLFYNNSSQPKYLVDTLKNVIKYPLSKLAWVKNLDYSLAADSGDTWIVYVDTVNGEGNQGRAYVNDTFDEIIFGKSSSIKEIYYFVQMYGDTTKNDGSYTRTDHIAAGFGLVYREMEGGTVQPDFIGGVIIDGDTLGLVTALEKSKDIIPENIVLLKNYPNPFNNKTYINFVLKDKANIILNVYNVLGLKVSEVINQELFPGRYRIPFDAGHLSSGEYFYTLATKNGTWVGKMLLIK